MKRVAWMMLVLATALAGAFFHRVALGGSSYSIFNIDLQIGGSSTKARLASGTPRGNEVSGLSKVFDTSREKFAPRSGCLDEHVIKGSRVIALGAYEGDEPVPVSFAGEGHEVTRIAVQGKESGPPVVLVVSAYDPVVWDFAGFPTKRLRGVIAYGYADQAVAHLDRTIPVRFVTRETGSSSCGLAIYPYKQSPDLGRLREQVKATLGVPLQAFYGSYSPNALHVDGSSFAPVAPAKVDAASLIASGPLQVGGLMPGDQGLRQLIDRGDIRPARPSDWEQWRRKSGETGDTFTDDGFVVLRKVTLPRGMYGAHSRAFIIPADVSQPTDLGSHNRYYRLKDGACISCG